MRIVVIGAGVVGVATAYHLVRKGYQVHVIDRSSHPCAGASDVNACLLVPGDSGVWPGPSAPARFLKAMLGKSAGPLSVPARSLPGLSRWGADFLSRSRPGRSAGLTAASLALSRYSVKQLGVILDETSIDIDHFQGGMVFLYPDAAALAAGRRSHADLAALGEDYVHLSPDDLVALDPAYAHVARHLHGALHATSCGSGDCGAFTRLLADRATRDGVTFSLGTKVSGLTFVSGQVSGVRTDAGEITADRVVIAAGHCSPALLDGIARLPLAPVRGYSVTVPILEPATVPRFGGYDDATHTAFARIGNRMRLASVAEFGPPRQPDARFAALREAADRLCPDGALDWSAAVRATGYRPVMSRDLPVIGEGPVRGLFLNTGHGHLGWTQACGSAAMLSDLISGRRPALDPAPFHIAA